MNSDIEIVYDYTLYRMYDKFIKNIINNFQNKQLILFKSKHYENRDNICATVSLVKLLDNNYCEKCNKYSDYFGHCIEHYNQSDINKYRKEFLDQLIKSNKFAAEFIHFHNEYKKILFKHIMNLQTIKKYYFNNIYTQLNFNDQKASIKNKEIYINNNIINYDNINIIFENNTSYIIIKNMNINNKREQNIIILLIFLLNKFKYDTDIYIDLIKCPDNNINKNTFIGNNNILYNKIYNSNLISNIEYMSVEKTVIIEGHKLRFDLYLIIKTCDFNENKFKYFELYIETDESHHYTNNDVQNSYDVMKDIYCIRNGISLLRLHMKNNKISENNINLCIFFIYYLINIKSPIYYFPQRYINTKNKYIKNINNKEIDINDISFSCPSKSIDLNNYKNINEIDNIDKIIKSDNLTELIKKFSPIIEFNEENYNGNINKINEYLKQNNCNLLDENIKNHKI